MRMHAASPSAKPERQAQAPSPSAKPKRHVLTNVMIDCVHSLSRNGLNLREANAVAKALKVNGSLTHLAISENNLGDDGKRALAAALPSHMRSFTCDKLELRADATILDLCGKDLGPGDAALLAGAIQSFMGSLTRVDVSSNYLPGEGRAILQTAVKGRSGFELQL